jgi:hypothetical protein
VPQASAGGSRRRTPAPDDEQARRSRLLLRDETRVPPLLDRSAACYRVGREAALLAGRGYGFALTAHPGESQGRPTINAGSKPNLRHPPARPAFAPGCPCPGRSHRTHRPGRYRRSDRSLGHDGSSAFIPVTNLLERSLAEIKRRAKVIGRFPGETGCLTLVCAVLDLYISHAKNGVRFSQLERHTCAGSDTREANQLPTRR